MIKLYNLVTKKIEECPDDIELSEIPSHYKHIRETGQCDKNGIKLYVGDVVSRNLMLVFHNDYEDIKILTDEDHHLEIPEAWVKIYSIYDKEYLGKPKFIHKIFK